LKSKRKFVLHMDLSAVLNLAWQLACRETVAASVRFIDPEHFLAALTKLRQFCAGEAADTLRAQGLDVSMATPEMKLAADVLEKAGIEPDAFRHELRERLGKGTYQHAQGDTVHRSDRSRRVFQRAEDFAREMASTQIRAGHVLLAVFDEKDSPACALLKEKRTDASALAEITLDLMRQQPALLAVGGQRLDLPEEPQSGTPFLDRYGRDLNREAREGKLGPVIGRRKEILQVIQTLARRTKNNPVLVGEAGVGKTAVVEAVAIRAAQGKDPQVLAGKRIVELNMGALTAGTKYRGEFEDRLTRILDEARRHPDVVVFIDELHTVIGAGRAEGSTDAANLMKPALARGDLRCIGATTVAEYRRYIESDPALERRFEKLLVPEPTREEAIEILHGLRPRWEEHHHVKITDAALTHAVDLSIRFDCDHQLPDKAIDLADKAGARTQVPMLSMNQGISKQGSGEAQQQDVTEVTIAQVLSDKIGIPLEVITGYTEGMSRSRLLDMEQALRKRVMAQDEAVERVCRRLAVAQAALGQRRGPLGVLLFLGPTGVGKTELARSMAIFLFGSERDMIRLDMSEFMEEHSVAKLIGSPPGYIGHEEEGQLTGKLRTRPHSVVLLDEIEKAHPRVFDLFLQVFDEGRLTDSKGRTADARHAIFILTSNIAAAKKVSLGFAGTPMNQGPSIQDELKKHFRAEFINRIDEQILFRPLDKKDVKAILHPILDGIAASLREKHHKNLQVTEQALDLLASLGHSDELGVRHLQRTVQTLLEFPLSRLILSGKIRDWPAVLVTAEEKQIELKPGSVNPN
jgi:ATP-dependent Clp protease ATP-binding subunit ClpC